MENSYVIFGHNNSTNEVYFKGAISPLGNPQTSVKLGEAMKFADARAAYAFATEALPSHFYGQFRVGRRHDSVKLPYPTDATRRAARDARVRALHV